MSFSIKHTVFAHDFLNPPSEDRSCSIDIVITNGSGKIDLVKESPGLQTRFTLIITDSSIVGLTSSDQSIVELTVRDLLLAFNLILSRTCLSTLGGDLHPAEITSKTPTTSVTIEEAPEGRIIKIAETLTLRDSVHITIGTREEINEKQVIDYYNKITRVKRHSPNPSVIKELNIGKALKEYESAMSTFDRLRIFKYLFNTIEFCANWNGTTYKGQNLDSIVASISKVPQADVEFWRGFYNRTKHVDRTASDASEYVQGMEKLPEILPKLREAAKQLISDCLNQI
jgi:hypothetical protein